MTGLLLTGFNGFAVLIAIYAICFLFGLISIVTINIDKLLDKYPNTSTAKAIFLYAPIAGFIVILLLLSASVVIGSIIKLIQGLT